jgi:hypothetical protein
MLTSAHGVPDISFRLSAQDTTPLGSLERLSVVTVDGQCHDLEIPMIPLRASIIITVRELVPYSDEHVEQLVSDSDYPWTSLDLHNASVLMRDQHSKRAHKFVAVPICQHRLVAVKDVISGEPIDQICP